MLGWKILRTLLIFSSFGFYTLPIAAGECPIHPRDPEEMRNEDDRHRRQNSPERELGDENQKENYQKGQSDWAKRKD